MINFIPIINTNYEHKIMKYTIITSSRFEELIKMVNELIAEGWIPQGGICESGNGAIYHYSQAMINK